MAWQRVVVESCVAVVVLFFVVVVVVVVVHQYIPSFQDVVVASWGQVE